MAIVACSTPPGRSGIAVVRLSGKNSNKIVIAPEKSIYREKKDCILLNKKLYPNSWHIIKE